MYVHLSHLVPPHCTYREFFFSPHTDFHLLPKTWHFCAQTQPLLSEQHVWFHLSGIFSTKSTVFENTITCYKNRFLWHSRHNPGGPQAHRQTRHEPCHVSAFLYRTALWHTVYINKMLNILFMYRYCISSEGLMHFIVLQLDIFRNSLTQIYCNFVVSV